MKQYRNNFRGPRAGVTVTELVVAAALLSAALLLAIQTVHLAGRQQQVGRSQRLALQEASGAMERLMALPYDELTSEAALTGDTQLALQALLAHPLVPSFAAAESLLAAFLAEHRDYLPQFTSTRQTTEKT